jgi:hypothetical protein
LPGRQNLTMSRDVPKSRLPLYEAALQLADTFGLLRNREEELVK